jgi:hypothetical protein
MSLSWTSCASPGKLTMQYTNLKERKKLPTNVGFDPLGWCYVIVMNIVIEVSITFVWATLMGCVVGFCMVRIIGKVTRL